MLLQQWQTYRQLRHSRPASTLMLAIFILGLVAVTACAQTRHVTRESHVLESGFLGTELYSKLTPGREDDLELAFRRLDTTAEYHQYTKVLVDPVLVYYEATLVAIDMVLTMFPGAAKAPPVKRPAFVGAIEAEFTLSHSMTGTMLGAGIDRRVGGKTLSNGWSRWSDVHNAMDFWTLQTAYRPCRGTGRPGCAKPTYGTRATLKTEVEK